MIDALPASLIVRLLDEAPDAVTIIDGEGTIRYMNPSMQALSGYAPGEALGQPLSGLLPDSLAAQHQQHVRSYIEGKKVARVLGHVREFAIRHRSGSMIPIELRALDLGAANGTHYLGAFMQDLRPRRKAEEEKAALMAQLEKQALTDTLTGVANRRAFEHDAALSMARARRSGAAMMVGIADIDHFKRVNDQHGHPVGDQVLCQIAQRLCGAARATDVVARIGGEEFGLLLPDADPARARQVAERIRAAVQAHAVDTGNGASLAVTISIGLARLDPHGSLDAALAAADAALYRAKENGRNRVEGGERPSA